jgi:flagellar basal body-associated protein FliL
MSSEADGVNRNRRLWTFLRAAYVVLALASALLLTWVLNDEGWSRMTVVFLSNVIVFAGLSWVANSRLRSIAG